MDWNQARIDILNWMTSFVEKSNPMLNGWAPCPYARQARLNGEFDLRPGRTNPYHDINSVVMEEFTVIAYVYDPKLLDVQAFNDSIDKLNQDFLLDRSLIALGDHPKDPEVVNGVSMNQGEWAIAFVQDLAKLDDAAEKLARQGYYKDWPADYLHNLFQHRRNPL